MKNNTSNRKASGLTLVELLVAIAVLSIIIALIVPQLRIANKERNIRETARVAGSAVSAAREQATIDGFAGIAIERNPNFIANTPAGNQVFYAGTRLFKLRRKPDYVGDSNEDRLTAYLDPADPTTIQCQMTAPLEHFPAANRFVVLGGDLLIHDGSRYRIREILDVRTVIYSINGTPDQYVVLLFNLDWDNDFIAGNDLNTAYPDAKTGEAAPPLTPNVTDVNNIMDPVNLEDFRVARLRKDRNSIVDLPEGYIIDLRYSGLLDSNDIDSDPDTHTLCSLANDSNDFFMLFDEQGGLSDLIFTVDGIPTILLAGQGLSMFVNEFDPNNVVNDVRQQAEALLSGEDNLWLTVGLNGGVFIGYNVPPESGAVDSMIFQSRALSFQRVSARN